jgi:molecular chaperone DnaJ
MAAKRDYYEVLGVARGADEKEIKSAFRKKAKELHPDKNKTDKDAEKKFKELNEAYEVLKDKDKRAAYDRFGHGAFDGGAGGFGGGGGAGAGGFGDGFADFSDIFGDIFGDFMGGRAGGRRSSGGPERGADLRHNLTINLKEAYTGVKKNIKYNAMSTCEDCSGKGAKNSSDIETCSVCRGSGKERAQQGFFVIEKTCSRCAGKGKVIKNPCKTCAGQGRVRKSRNIAVNIPAGVEDGMRIRVEGGGEAGSNGGPTGDLYVFVTIPRNDIFERDSHMLHCAVPIKFTIATLGGSIEVPTIDGKKVKVNIPAGTQTGDQFRLRGKGMPKLQTASHGDLILHARVETPVNLSAKQKELLQEFDAEGGNHSPSSDSFFSKVKKLFS